MKPLSKMNKKELKKLTKEQQQQLAIQEIQELISKDTIFDGATIEVQFKDKKHSNLRVLNR